MEGQPGCIEEEVGTSKARRSEFEQLQNQADKEALQVVKQEIEAKEFPLREFLLLCASFTSRRQGMMSLLSALLCTLISRRRCREMHLPSRIQSSSLMTRTNWRPRLFKHRVSVEFCRRLEA